MVNTLYEHYVGHCPLSGVYSIYSFWKLTYCHPQVTGHHYTDRLLLFFILILVPIVGEKTCEFL
jgi:hypothetical protein